MSMWLKNRRRGLSKKNGNGIGKYPSDWWIFLYINLFYWLNDKGNRFITCWFNNMNAI